MGELFTLAETGAVDPLLHPVYGFEQGARAIQDIADRKVVGKVVVSV
jgi:NADPH2:quinone reductase